MIPYLPLQRITAMHADELHAAARQVIDSGRYLQGGCVAAFERHYADYIGTPHCVATGNGYDALWLIFNAYRQLGVFSEGDEVLVSGHTFIASVSAVSDNRLCPVLIDARKDTLQLDDTLLEQALTPRTRAMLLVHLYGRCALTERIARFCEAHNLLLIEDNAQAQGAEVSRLGDWSFSRLGNIEDAFCESTTSNDQSNIPNFLNDQSPKRLNDLSPKRPIRTGSLGHAAAHSFYPGKNLGALGDAGAVTTHDSTLADTIRAIANYGMTRKYVCDYRGRNSRMDELQAAMLDVKLRYLDQDNARRQTIARRYISEIKHPLLYIPPDDGTHVYHIFPVLCPERARLQQHLATHGIETLIHYPIPIHRQRCNKNLFAAHLPVAELIAAQELSLPCHPAMTDDEATAVIQAVNSFKG